MKYDIEADWLILTGCNYSCDYCPVIRNYESSIKVFGTPEDWKEGFDSTNKTWLLHITGGEPSLYPDYVSLCETLSQTHYLWCSSNLSQLDIIEFVNCVDPERVVLFNASFHFSEVKGNVCDFSVKVRKLRGAGFNVMVTSVMTPEVIFSYSSLCEKFKAFDITPVPKVMRSLYRKKHYPRSYSYRERSLLLQYLSDAESECRQRLPTDSLYSIGAERWLLDNGLDFRGIRFCASGSKFVRIFPDGSVYRCNHRYGDSLGNILQCNVQFLAKPELCHAVYCPYYCLKYSSLPFAENEDERALESA